LDIGIFSKYDWNLLMCKCLASMDKQYSFLKWRIAEHQSEISLADGGSLTTGPSADSNARFEIGRLPKPQRHIGMLSPVF